MSEFRRSGSAAERGYVFYTIALGLPFFIGLVGLAVDVGRMYITKSEAQSYADGAALAASLPLDGTQTGVALATTAATTYPMDWKFGTTAFSSVQVQFATSTGGPWTASPPNPPTGYYFVQVTTSVQLPMYFMRVLTNVATSEIGAVAIAGRQSQTNMSGGEFPFSPYTRIASPDDASDPYGYKIGNQYTLRWGAPGTRTTCGTDATSANLSSNGKIRGYCCAGSASSLRDAIVTGNTDPVTVGNPVPMDNGAKNTEMPAIALRVDMDTDTTSTSYAQYRSLGLGNGERVVVVPVNAGAAQNYDMVGFAGFFLLQATAYTGLGGNDSACAEYIGAWVEGAPPLSPGGSGAYHLKLLQ
jgi:Flp pilus assembly protein TadG